MLESPTKVRSVTQDVALIRHLKEHLYALSDQRVLDLLSLATVKPVTNADARPIFGLGRAGTWSWLSRLVNLGMLEKRGQAYKASPYSENLIEAVSITFQNVLSGKVPTVRGQAWTEALKLASEGAETEFQRGKTDQTEHARQVRMLKELEAQLDAV